MYATQSSGQEVLAYIPLHFGAADAEIKVPSAENTELIGSPFKA